MIGRYAVAGGWVVFGMREEFLENDAEYNGRLVPYLDAMQKKGIIKYTKNIFPNYILGRNGVLFVIEKI